MTTWLLPVSLLLTFLAGVLLLTAYLWYRYALRLHAESLSPENALGVRLLRYGGAAGLSSFGGFLLVFVFYLPATRTGSTAVTATVPLLEVAVGLFLCRCRRPSSPVSATVPTPSGPGWTTSDRAKVRPPQSGVCASPYPTRGACTTRR